jgi:peptidoglycan/xylan/chitin deacetylase (PgdA/CDA1 family)
LTQYGPVTRALLYHDVAAPDRRDEFGFPGPAAARYKLDPGAFDAHLDAIAATGVAVGLVGDDPAPAAAITFDDGGASALAAADALERRGWRGHFLVVSGRVGTPGFLDADGVRELSARGHAVGSHSHTHPAQMNALAPLQLLAEWEESRELLGEIVGTPPVAAGVPGGSVSGAVIDAAATAGYELLMTSTPLARPRRVGAMTVMGRYGIWAGTPAARAAAYARGALAPRLRLRAGHEVKRVARRASPRLYGAARRGWSARGG